jgi:Hsp70 protein
LISDAAAGLAALRTKPGFPRDGVVALCDFGAGGTTVTLTNASQGFQQIGQSVRYTDFSGEAIDHLLADYVRSGGQKAATSTNVAAAARPASPTLLGECRRGKEQLSSGTVATIATGEGADFRLSRTELEQLISAPLDQFLATLTQVLQRNGIPHASLAAVAALGGVAGTPLITARLSERLRVPVLTIAEPMFSAAIGAAALGAQQLSAGAATAAGAAVELPTELVATPETEALPNRDAGTDKPTYALAWSQDSATGEEPVPYTGPEHSGGYGAEPTAPATAPEERQTAEPGPLPWYKRTALVVSVAAAIAAVLLAVVLALTVGHGKTNPANTTPKEPSQTPQTVTITGPNHSPTTTVIQPPPATSQPPATTTQPPATTTVPTTTTQPPTTTTSQQTTSSQATTTAPSTSTQQTTTAASTPPTRRPLGPGGGR